MNLAIFFFIFYYFFLTFGQEYTDITVAFKRIVTTQNKIDTTVGHVYHTEDQTAIIVEKPLAQWVISNNDGLLIYYPDENKALKLLTKSDLIFLKLFLNKDESLGLSERGFLIENSEVIGDTLIFFWKPPEYLGKNLKHILMYVVDNRTVATKSITKNGRTILATYFNNFINYKNDYYPMEIIDKKYFKSGLTTERIIFSNAVFGTQISDFLKNFSIPKNTKIIEIN